MMQEDVGIYRDKAGLEDALGRVGELQRRAASARAPSGTAAFNPGWHLCRDLRNMLIVAEAVARAALLRHESRGAHSRLDFPNCDDYWGEHNTQPAATPAARRRGRQDRGGSGIILHGTFHN